MIEIFKPQLTIDSKITVRCIRFDEAIEITISVSDDDDNIPPKVIRGNAGWNWSHKFASSKRTFTLSDLFNESEGEFVELGQKREVIA